MAKAGLLVSDHNLVDGTSPTTADLRVVVDTGASPDLSPSWSNCTITSAIPWSRRSASRAQPSIGIDVELYTTGQMFREMQAALLFARGKEVRNNVMRGNSPPKAIPVKSREALEWGDRQRRRGVSARQEDRHVVARQEGRHRQTRRGPTT